MNRRLRNEVANRPLPVCPRCQQPHRNVLEMVEEGCAPPEAYPEFTNPRKRAFLIAFAERGHVGKASKQAGISRYTIRDWRRTDPAFVEAFKDAHEESVWFLRDIALSRAVRGTRKAVGWYKGDPGGYEYERDHQLLQLLLKSYDPDTFRDRSDVNVKGITANLDLDKLSHEQLLRLANGESPLSVLGGAAKALPPGKDGGA